MHDKHITRLRASVGRYASMENSLPHNIKVLKPHYRVNECLEEIRHCLETGWTGRGAKTEEFERAWCDYTKHRYSHFLNSASSGLHLALECLATKTSKRKIITTPLTFVATNHAIIQAGFEPLFADVDETLNLDPQKVEELVSEDVAGVMFVGLGGNSANLSDVQKIAKDNGLWFILDAAHMAGSRHDGHHVGLDADFTIYSYQVTKNIPTADAGMICCKDKDDDVLIRKLSWFGIEKDPYNRLGQGAAQWEYNVQTLGYKYSGNAIMAALGLVGLKYLDIDNERRRSIFSMYKNGLKNVNIIDHFNASETSQHLVQCTVKNRVNLLEYLAQNNIFPGVHYTSNLKYSALYSATAPKAAHVSDTLMSLPCHINLSNEEINHVIDVVNNFDSA